MPRVRAAGESTSVATLPLMPKYINVLLIRHFLIATGCFAYTLPICVIPLRQQILCCLYIFPAVHRRSAIVIRGLSKLQPAYQETL